MKRLFLALAFFSCLAYLYWYLTHSNLPLAPVYLSPSIELLQKKPHSAHEVYEYIKKINIRNSQIKSFFVENMQIKVTQNRTSVTVNGQLAMKKNNFFRLLVWHEIMGQEMDIGSNDQLFWFWSKRMENPALYYAKHEDLNKTMLKTPLNPAWLIESLNLGDVEIKNIEITKFKNFWAVIQPRISPLGEKVTVVYLIDPEKIDVIGRYLYNENGHLVASTETQEFTNHIPKKLLIIWYDEGVAMEWQLTNPKINIEINQNYWKMPDNKRKINMGK